MLVVLATRIMKKKGIQIEKEVKIILFADYITLYIKYPKDSRPKKMKQNTLQLINAFSQVAGNKINTQKSINLSYLLMTNNLEKKKSGKQIYSQLPQKKSNTWE